MLIARKAAASAQADPAFDDVLRAIVSVRESDVVGPRTEAPERRQIRRKGK